MERGCCRRELRYTAPGEMYVQGGKEGGFLTGIPMGNEKVWKTLFPWMRCGEKRKKS